MGRRDIQKEYIKDILLSNKGLYSKGKLKKAYSYISERFNIPIDLVREAINDLKVKVDTNVNSVGKVSQKSSNSFNICTKKDAGNVLVIGDTHLPFIKEGYLDFCNDTRKKYDCKTIVHIGDEIDNCAISQYSKDPDGLSAGTEADLALKSIRDWYKAFPEVNVCIGNHSNRMFRLAHEVGIPKRMLKTYEELWEAPKGWIWQESWNIDGVHYTHGSGMSGANAAIKKAIHLRQSTVIGHIHTEATIQYNVSAIDSIWGMQVGCGIDDKAYAFNYAKENLKKSIISCGVVVENGRMPILELMKL